MSRIILGSKLNGETSNIVFDFTSRLAIGETITTAVVSATVYSGIDSAPAVISGSAAISGQKVTQKVTAGVVGVIYDLECVIVTSGGQVLSMGGYLAVVQS